MNLPTKSIAAAAFLALPALSLQLNPRVYEGGRSRDEADRELRNSSSVAVILGEIRSSFSDMMFIKTERYLHSGIAYAPHINSGALASKGTVENMKKPDSRPDHHDNETPEEHAAHANDVASRKSSETSATLSKEHTFKFAKEFAEHQEEVKEQAGGAHGDHDHDHEHEEEHVATIIRTRDQDFRGFIGDLEREVKPWQDPSIEHQHTDGTELLPWYRLQTLSDPHNTRGYLIGAWWLKSLNKPEQLEEAIRFIDEGIRNNPKAFQLHLMRGNLLRVKNADKEALPSFRKAAELASAQRPPKGPEDPNPGDWIEYTEEDCRAAMRFAVLLEKQYGSRDEALRLARKYLAQVEADSILARQIDYLTGEEVDPMAAGPATGPAPAPATPLVK